MLLATQNKVYAFDPMRSAPRLLRSGREIAVIAEGASINVVADTHGRVEIIANGGSQVIDTGIDEPIHSMLILAEEPLDLLFGTEGANLFRLDRGGQARRDENFAELGVRKEWYTPWGGPPHVRSMAFSAGSVLYADIEVGSIMRSEDHGRSWQPVETTIHPDVHQVATTPAAPGNVYANTRHSVFISEDRGRSWRDCGEGLGHRYGRAIAVSPVDPSLVLASASDGPHGENLHGQLFRSHDCGRTWIHISEGFPDQTRENIDTHHVAFSTDGTAWAIVGNKLYVGQDGCGTFASQWEAPEPIEMISAAIKTAQHVRGDPSG